MSASQWRKNNTQTFASASGGSSALAKNKRKQKFDCNNGKCVHDLDAVILESRTEMNPGRLFLRCPLWERVDLRCDCFVWADEIHSNGGKNLGMQETNEEISWKNGQPKLNVLEEDMKKLHKLKELKRSFINQLQR
ncbi:hypothetical protein PIB30_060692 [Stylosanthes scabra]|uniref:GRF-type domain-containing protein n=1 Tax=Stylosanthes scabra TaxID=79078 RepID=A0ABU6SKP1_9FABA|nr:hypothetical protein [Stylosanthes scabra]